MLSSWPRICGSMRLATHLFLRSGLDVEWQRPGGARYGGQEFVILLPHTDLASTYLVAERVRAEVEALMEPHLKATLGTLTISVGVTTTVPAGDATPCAFIEAADVFKPEFADRRPPAAGRCCRCRKFSNEACAGGVNGNTRQTMALGVTRRYFSPRAPAQALP